MTRLGPALHQVRRRVDAALADLANDQPVLVACSGGPDSLAVAAAAAATRRRVGAVVVDHGLQEGSAQVADRAANQCRDLGLDPVLVRRVRVTATGAGPEADARTARYDALTRVATECGAAALLLAHTADDQAETVLLGLARGSGVRSLAGMPHRRGLFRRPVLDLSRADLAAALAESGLTAWTDPHNADPRFTRVRVRSRVLPVLEAELGPGVCAALVRTARLARADADALDEWAGREFALLSAAGFPVDGLAALPLAVRSRVLRRCLIDAGAPPDRLTADHVAEVERLVAEWSGQGPVHVPRVIVSRRCGRLILAGDESMIGAHDGA